MKQTRQDLGGLSRRERVQRQTGRLIPKSREMLPRHKIIPSGTAYRRDRRVFIEDDRAAACRVAARFRAGT